MTERENLTTANAHRAAAACRRDAARTAAAITALKSRAPRGRQTEETHNAYIDALQWRAAMPDSTLAEIAAAIGDSKDAYSARLRRAYARAGVA